MALILGVSCTGAAFAADQILTNQTIEGNYAANEYALLIVKNGVEWMGTRDESVNYSQNTINYTASSTSSRTEGVISITSEGPQGAPELTISGYGNVSFDSNNVSGPNTRGSAIHVEGSNKKEVKNATLNIIDNTQVSFNGNTAAAPTGSSYGGAICLHTDSTANISGNGSVSFNGNTADAKTYAYGGAIYTTATINAGSGKVTDLSISENENVSFINNTAKTSQGFYAQGGAIHVARDTKVDIKNNTGKVEFIGNGVQQNSSSAKGGAIYVAGGYSSSDTKGELSICGNQEVVFAGNYERDAKNDTYRLRSLYGMNAGKGIHISAKTGGSVEFRDSIYINGSINLNEDYNGEEQAGKIIFSGRTTVEDLEAAIAANTAEGEIARDVTEDEIINSRTSEITGKLTICNGTLSLQDGAILNAKSVTIASGATLEGVLSQAQGISTFGLEEAAIAATQDADLVLEDGATFTLDGGLIDMANNNVTIGDGVCITATNLDISAEDGMVTLFANINKLTIDSKTAESGVIMMNINGVEQEVTYDATDGVIKVSAGAIPEPTTATLSLLALAALAARRRRK